MNKIYAIVVTFNGKLWYDKCFSSLAQSSIPVNTIVIDNASSDDTVEFIKTKYPEIILIKSEKNLGFGQANNIGIRYALENNADYFFLLNQDAWIESNTIIDLINLSENNPEYGILSPFHLNSKKNKIENGFMHYITDSKITDPSIINDMYFRKFKDIYDTKYVNAAAWLLPRKTVEIIGGFDPLFFHYGEDDNYMHRVIFHQMKIGICPKITICHDTENRIINKKYITETSKKSLLVEFTNINNNINIYKFLLYSFKKSTMKFLKFNFKNSKTYIENSLYIWKLRHKIRKSVIQNKKSFPSWL
jgi:GT2 family glycosyltransferase